MIVSDTSALISLATAEVVDLVFAEFEVHTTRVIIQELEEPAEYDDPHGQAAWDVLEQQAHFSVHTVDGEQFESSTIDQGEASCIRLEEQLEPAFLLTDDLRALPEIQTLTTAKVALSPIVLRALVKRGVLEPKNAQNRLEQIAKTRAETGLVRRSTAVQDSPLTNS